MANPPIGQGEVYGRKPSKDFEEANGLKGISRTYAMPDDRPECASPAVMDRWLHARFNEATASTSARAANLKTFNVLGNEVVARNPELKSVRRNRNDIHHEYAFLAGVSAGYNPNDIDYYLRYHQWTAAEATHETQMAHLKRMDELVRRQEAIAEALRKSGSYTPLSAGCIFSPSTLAAIERQVGLGLRQARPGSAPTFGNGS